MSNIIHADFYRIRKGAAIRNTMLGIFATILVVGLTFFFIQSGAFQSMIESQLENVSSQLSQGEIVSMQGDLAEMDETMGQLPQNAAEFSRLVMGENIFTLFILVIAIAVTGADFGAGTFRNTLSYETDRKKVYIAKFLFSCVVMLALLLAGLVFSWLLGGVLFGFGGFSGAYFADILTLLALQMPIYLALLSFAQCLVAFTQKSGAAIAAYLLVVMLFSSVVQILTMLLPTVRWISYLDFLSAIQLVSNYQTAPAAEIVMPLITGVVVLAGTFAAGLVRYQKADLH